MRRWACVAVLCVLAQAHAARQLEAIAFPEAWKPYEGYAFQMRDRSWFREMLRNLAEQRPDATWVRRAEGPAPLNKAVRLNGNRYVVGNFCRPRHCATHRVTFAVHPDTGAVWARLTEEEDGAAPRVTWSRTPTEAVQILMTFADGRP